MISSINTYNEKNAGYTQLVERTGSILQENEMLDVSCRIYLISNFSGAISIDYFDIRQIPGSPI
jgi:hypothetical protein